LKNCAVHARRNQEYFEGTAEDSSGKRSGRKGESWRESPHLPRESIDNHEQDVSRNTNVRTGCGTTERLQIGKGVCQGCILSPCLFNLYAEYIIQNARLDMKHKLESRLPGEISITSDMQMTAHYGRKQRTKELLDESERGE